MGWEIAIRMEQLDELVRCCIPDRTIPTNLILRHRPGGGHFQGLRFAERMYNAFLQQPDKKQPDCRTRLHEVQEHLWLATSAAEPAYGFDTPLDEPEKRNRAADAVAAMKPDARHRALVEAKGGKSAAPG